MIHTPEIDLDEGSLRMIASGWELHTGEITESDIIIYDFNMMEGVVFKKLKEANHDHRV